MYFKQGMIVITYAYDWLLFGTNIKEIQKVVKEIKNHVQNFNCEDRDKYNIFSFLGVSIKPDKE